MLTVKSFKIQRDAYDDCMSYSSALAHVKICLADKALCQEEDDSAKHVVCQCKGLSSLSFLLIREAMSCKLFGGIFVEDWKA